LAGVKRPVAPPSFDLTDAAVMRDPYPVFAELRAAGGLLWSEPLGCWLAGRHADADAVLRDRRLGRVFRRREPEQRFGLFNTLHVDSLLDSEPPQHTRLRRLLAGVFTRGRVERLRSAVQELADGLLDRALSRGDGELDLLADYAEPLPVAVIAELLGVPGADRHLLRPWSQAMVAMYEVRRTPEMEAAAVRACAEFDGYLRGLAEARRSAPADDLVTALAATPGLSDDELVANAILLLNAGHEASVNGFGNGMLAALHTDELERLRRDPALLPRAVEELVRYDAPLQLFERTAYDDVELGGVTVRTGEKVAALLGSANRDPEVFPEPDRLDLGRDPNPHLGFGAGIHFCLGAPLARLELSVSVATLLRRVPQLTLAEEPVLRPRFVLRGRQSLRVRV